MGRIWVVDDQPDVSRAMVALLRQVGHRGTAFLSGEAALTELQKDIPDLMILDVMMPGLDGFAVLRAVRDDPRTAKLPVIMFSAVSDPSRIAHAISRGATDYWVKASFDFSELEARLNQHIADTNADPAKPA
ncbi:MAG TPA: response regulator [Tepidisphaeraceae bacterium]|nr:response regulator [Tepidisphaeraceae bacterium]